MSRDEFEQEDWDDGYDEGYSAGKDDGYDSGYEEGKEEAEGRISDLEEQIYSLNDEIEKLEDACLVCKTVLSQAEQ